MIFSNIYANIDCVCMPLCAHGHARTPPHTHSHAVSASVHRVACDDYSLSKPSSTERIRGLLKKEMITELGQESKPEPNASWTRKGNDQRMNSCAMKVAKGEFADQGK